ncbi:thiamine biosynthesis protein ThiS [Sporocytophaga myxococcoides]|uniref:Thiamine biosynthesis protein ThiS n=1 Tax=Sporocytophaga myxococcoides TaxID=153721 RepID=A0A098LK46_9BACT|nr:sulfur carrier protein ThiS [Sporocytophaga myxococcoides]GAL87356.1 thiamine biosynthesis protein ThiS [Sporocytophaga myxococcoides]
MEVIVNNERTPITSNKLSALLDQLNIKESKGVAVAINDRVLPKKHWPTQTLKDQDKVTIIRATQGG